MAAFGDLDGRAVVDVGAGNGVLGLGALMLGAASVHLLEADPGVAEVAERNAAEVGGQVEVTVLAVQAAVDLGSVGGAVLISNPPWGVQTTGADRPILEAMFTSEAGVIHLMHHAEAGHVEALAASHGWHAENVLRAPFRLPLVHAHQRSGRRDTEALPPFHACLREERIQKEGPRGPTAAPRCRTT